MEKVSVIGLGYVGLPLMCAIARSKKYKVIGFDISRQRTEDVTNRICPIKDETCEKDLKEVKFQASSDPEILKDTDYFIICVPTPIYSDYNPNYEPLIGAAKIVAKYLKKDAKVIVESTINPGTCEEVVQPELEKLSKLKCGTDFSLAHCPERINPGDPKWNVYNIPRNVGSIPEEKAEEYAEFYRTFINAEVNAVSNIKVAESTKIIENTFRDLNIAFVNELAQSFDKMGIDLHETIKAASNKPFAFMAHYPGCGVGGHCIAVDPYYLIKKAETSGFNHRFLKEARAINNFMPRYAVMRLMEGMNEVGKALRGSKIVLLGMSYKPNVGDTRESPSYEVLEVLQEYGADVVAIDPFVKEFNHDMDTALNEADAIFLATSHKEFITKLKPAYINKKGIKVILDGRNVLDRKGIMEKGIVYKGIGR